MRISAAKNFDMLSISINALDFRVLQVWEQMLPFQGSSNLYAATRFLQSRLCSQADIDKVTALQNVYTKPRSEIFIPSGKGCKEGICVCKPKIWSTNKIQMHPNICRRYSTVSSFGAASTLAHAHSSIRGHGLA